MYKVLFAACVIVAGIMATVANAEGFKLRVLHSFCTYDPPGCFDGWNGPGTLVMDASGNIFGTTYSGGFNQAGTVFKLYRDIGRKKWKYRVIYNFCAVHACVDGQSPTSGPLVIDVDGNLYGMTGAGGRSGHGTAYRLTPNGNGKYWRLRTLYNFCSKNSSCTDGGDSLWGLVHANPAAPYDGTSPLYAAVSQGGKHLAGAVISLTPDENGKWHERVIYSFCPSSDVGCMNGQNPYGLTVDPGGNVLGVATTGQGSSGILFKLSPSERKQWSETVAYRFCSQENCIDGSAPNPGLVTDTQGDVFGTTAAGGISTCNFQPGCGVLFEIGSDDTETVLYNFCSEAENDKCLDGWAPEGGLFMDTSGNLYGATNAGGQYVKQDYYIGGTIFEFSGQSLQTLRSLCKPNDCREGEDSNWGVIADSSGNVFGSTYRGGIFNGGTVFELSPKAISSR